MIFNFKIPLFHRMTIFFAVLGTAKPLIEWWYGLLRFDSFEILIIVFLWLLVWHQWEQYKQSNESDTPIPPSRVERFLGAMGQDQYDRASVGMKVAYVAVLVVASIAIYFLIRDR